MKAQKEKYDPTDKDKAPPAWGLQAIMPKGPATDAFLKEIRTLLGRVVIDKIGVEKAKQLAPILRMPFRDGDNPKEVASLKNADQLAGSWFFNVRNQFKQPVIIGPTGRAVDPATLTTDDIYSGAHYRLLLNFGYYDKKGNKGVSAYINAVMKVKDGDRLDNAVTEAQAQSAFSDFADESAVDMFSQATGGQSGSEPADATQAVNDLFGGVDDSDASAEPEESGGGFSFM
jgi:hypothetical protein